jgi:myo-inositol-1(or 4)-monophosphatase
MNDFSKVFDVLNEVNRQAGAIVRRYYGRAIEVERKADRTPVTEADREVERFLRDALLKHFPDHGIYGEEYGDTAGSSRYRWIIDPIDGTKSFVMRTPLFGTLIALELDGTPVLGSIYLPIQNELLIGSKETGTFLNGKKCRVSGTRSLSEARLVITDPMVLVGDDRHRGIEALSHRVEITRGFGDCFGYFLVACGAADIMIDPVLEYHDVAALGPIIEGAGGSLSNLDGGSDLHARNAVATNRVLHDEVIAVLNSI